MGEGRRSVMARRSRVLMTAFGGCETLHARWRRRTKGPSFLRFVGPIVETLRELGNSGTASVTSSSDPPVVDSVSGLLRRPRLNFVNLLYGIFVLPESLPSENRRPI
jgi:hypothetical protein